MRGSIGIRGDDLAAHPGTEGPPGLLGDAVLDELDAAVGEEGIDAAAVPAPAGGVAVGADGGVLFLGMGGVVEAVGMAGVGGLEHRDGGPAMGPAQGPVLGPLVELVDACRAL